MKAAVKAKGARKEGTAHGDVGRKGRMTVSVGAFVRAPGPERCLRSRTASLARRALGGHGRPWMTCVSTLRQRCCDSH